MKIVIKMCLVHIFQSLIFRRTLFCCVQTSCFVSFTSRADVIIIYKGLFFLVLFSYKRRWADERETLTLTLALYLRRIKDIGTWTCLPSCPSTRIRTLIHTLIYTHLSFTHALTQTCIPEWLYILYRHVHTWIHT